MNLLCSCLLFAVCATNNKVNECRSSQSLDAVLFRVELQQCMFVCVCDCVFIKRLLAEYVDFVICVHLLVDV